MTGFDRAAGGRVIQGARRPTPPVFEGHAPGDTVRCPVDGCAFSGTVRQVATHAVETDDADHDAVERAIEGQEPGSASDPDRTPTPVEEFVRLFEDAHGERGGYESDRQGGWLFPFEGGGTADGERTDE